MEDASHTPSVLFVCLGNICRSPTGEGVMQHYVDQPGRETIAIDSAGTIGYHTGNPADRRMRAAAQKRGYELLSRSRQITRSDLDTFDLVIAMDRENLRDIKLVHSNPSSELRLLSDFLNANSGRRFSIDVPDPYYGGDAGFEEVLDMIEAAVPMIYQHLTTGSNAA